MMVVELKLPGGAAATNNVPIGTLYYYQQVEIIMNVSKDYPYATHLNIYCQPLEIVNVPALVAACTDQWYNQTLCRVNDSVVRLGVIKGEYHWHKHDNGDEFFFVIEGRLFVDLEERIVELEPRQGLVVPKGVVHRTRAPERTVMLAFENVGIVPTGDA
jgi:mannose-6-phosphate isomerase-like protein (cupin superfamily)